MLLPIAGFFLVGLPGFILAVWFSWFARLCWRRGLLCVIAAWLLTVTSIAAAIAMFFTAVASHDDHGAICSFFTFFAALLIAGGIPSGTIALTVSLLTGWLPQRVGLTMTVGTLSGLAVSVPALRLALAVSDTLW
jgi:hypothetical protein